MKTYQFLLVSGQIVGGSYVELPFGEFRTSSKAKLEKALEAAASGAVALASGHQFVKAVYKGRTVDARTIRPR